MNVASTPGKLRVSKAFHHSSNGTLITRPPSLSMALTFVSGAVSGATTVQGIPSSRAHHATPWAMFPADAVSTPRESVSGAIWPIAFFAPRILNEPMG
jgi:hypothetical protein